MARCTAPYNGHRTSSGRANCPACGGRGYGYSGGYGGRYGGGSISYSPPPPPPPRRISSGGGSSSKTSKPRWSRTGSAIFYTQHQVLALTPLREKVEELAIRQPDLRDVFLCHAWDDRLGAAKEIHDLLEAGGVKVWWSEKDAELGGLLMRSIDRGLASSRVGIVLVTPALLRRLQMESIADKELSVLLATNRLIPIVHNTTFEALLDISPMLASRTGLSTAEEPMADVAAKIAELVKITQTM